MPNSDMLLPLQLAPVDSLFFRDARPFEEASRAASGLPMPQTLAGALRTLLLEHHSVDFAQLANQIKAGKPFAEALSIICPAAAGVAAVRLRGPFFTLSGEVLVRVPSTLKQIEKTEQLVRLDPLQKPPPGWQPQAPGMVPLWRHGRKPAKAIDGFLKPSGLHHFLTGDVPTPDDVVASNDVYDFDDRTGIGLDEQSNTAQESLIYGIKMLALCPKAGLYAEVRGPADALAPLAAQDEPLLMPFGGEGRRVVVRAAEQATNWSQVPATADKGRLVLLTAPAYFNGWKPPALEPLAAAVGQYQAVSGWDLAQGGPKPNRFMVPAGSVYFLPPHTHVPSALVSEEDDALGWGSFLEGNWTYVG